MWSFKEIKQNYRFTEEDSRRLAGLRPLMEERVDAIVSTVAVWINSTKGTAQFFTDESGRQQKA